MIVACGLISFFIGFSVATSSMVGYVMGLGDRHVQNILVDKQSAEVIHIDFGKERYLTREIVNECCLEGLACSSSYCFFQCFSLIS